MGIVTRWPAATRRAGQGVVAVLLVAAPFAAALLAIDHAPPAQVEVAGQRVYVRPVLGQDSSRLFDGALVTPDHRRVARVDVGVDVDANWNAIVPSDKRTRRYLAGLWENPEPAVHLIESATRRHLLVWGATGFVAGALAIGSVLVLLRVRRRRLAGYTVEQAALVEAHNRRLRRTLTVAGLLLVVLVDAAGLRVYVRHDHRAIAADPQFAGTGLEGAQVKGLLADVLPFLSVLRPRSAFYDEVSDNLEQAIASQPSVAGDEDEVVFVLAEDFEDVNGMARQVGRAATLLDADFIALSGDLTFAGKAIETYLLDTLDFYAEGRPVYLAPGLHDTRSIIDAATARGWHVADGTTQTVAGLRLLSVPDPRVSTVGNFGAGTVLRDTDVDVDDAVADAVSTACEDEPDFVLVHDHLLGRRIAEAGCQRIAVLDGRSYEFIGPTQVRTASGSVTTELTTGSAGGHVDTRPDPGVIQHPARFAVLFFRPDTGGTTYSVITVAPDASVTMTPRVPLSTAFSASGG
ncbi:hypothetical protein [Nocardioides sp.]|uniref:hypothetical protein n=1 Tax=Nocardioides sp. TaxID=35761 RepID=UPI0037847E88